jgi:hypothetical protein
LLLLPLNSISSQKLNLASAMFGSDIASGNSGIEDPEMVSGTRHSKLFLPTPHATEENSSGEFSCDGGVAGGAEWAARLA